MSKCYIGSKIIRATPMGRQEFNDEKGVGVMRVTNDPGYRVEYPDGYVSWSPKATFEEAYREVSKMEKSLILQNNS